MPLWQRLSVVVVAVGQPGGGGGGLRLAGSLARSLDCPPLPPSDDAALSALQRGNGVLSCTTAGRARARTDSLGARIGQIRIS